METKERREALSRELELGNKAIPEETMKKKFKSRKKEE